MNKKQEIRYLKGCLDLANRRHFPSKKQIYIKSFVSAFLSYVLLCGLYFLLADIFDVCVPQQVERIVIIIIAISFLLGSVIGRYRIKLYGLYGWKTLAKYINTQAVNDRIDELSQINKDN